jgi:cytochrome c peroxidase
MNNIAGIVCYSALASSLLLTGCGGDDTNASTQLSEDVLAVVTALGLTGDPSTGVTTPSIDDPIAQLGMKLFFTKGLGGQQDSACVTCHHPNLGGGDDFSLPVGVDADIPDLLGPGRLHSVSGENFDGGPTVPRNSPTTFNVAFWDKTFFHDGRIESLDGNFGENGGGPSGIRTPDSALGVADPLAGSSLPEAQARFPVTSHEEMQSFEAGVVGFNRTQMRNELVERFRGSGAEVIMLPTNDWLAEFQDGFESPAGTAVDLITYENIAFAIGEYERSQVFVDSPWRAFVQGDSSAISDSAKRGALTFFNSTTDGGANCASCHSGDFFTDESFHVIAMPQVGRGKGNGPDGNDDFGRFIETGVAADTYAFRTPGLTNVSATGPWSHAGAYHTLEGVIRHHLDPVTASANFDSSQLEPNVQASDTVELNLLSAAVLADNRAGGVIDTIENVVLTDDEVDDLVAFVLSLTDPCVEDRSCLSPWIPDASDGNPDGLRINGFDSGGDLL